VPPLLTFDDLCSSLCISRQALTRWVRQGLLPAPVRLAGRNNKPRWRVADIEAWLDAGCPSAADFARQRPAAPESAAYRPYAETRSL
jgi:predicted DNA-binding transcriptional regulator AlpA